MAITSSCERPTVSGDDRYRAGQARNGRQSANRESRPVRHRVGLNPRRRQSERSRCGRENSPGRLCFEGLVVLGEQTRKTVRGQFSPPLLVVARAPGRSLRAIPSNFLPKRNRSSAAARTISSWPLKLAVVVLIAISGEMPIASNGLPSGVESGPARQIDSDSGSGIQGAAGCRSNRRSGPPSSSLRGLETASTRAPPRSSSSFVPGARSPGRRSAKDLSAGTRGFLEYQGRCVAGHSGIVTAHRLVPGPGTIRQSLIPTARSRRRCSEGRVSIHESDSFSRALR